MAHLKPRLLSHGTVECHDLKAARRFYTELLGMEVVQTSAISLMLRLNSTTTIACVETKGETSAGQYSHFGLDFETREEVDAAHDIVLAQKDDYGVRKVTRPVAPARHLRVLSGRCRRQLVGIPDQSGRRLFLCVRDGR